MQGSLLPKILARALVLITEVIFFDTSPTWVTYQGRQILSNGRVDSLNRKFTLVSDTLE